MKRGRTEEIQFGQPPPRVGGAAPHQRLITTIQPHNAGPTIQYQIASSAASPANVVGKATTTPADVAANLSQQVQSSQQQQQQQQVPQQPPPPSQPSSVQYTTTSYTTGIAGTNLVKTTGHAQPSAPQPAQQIHVVNTTSQVRGGGGGAGSGHKATTGGGGTGGPPGTGAGSVGGGGQVITTLAPNVISNAQPQPPPPPPQGQAQFQRLKV